MNNESADSSKHVIVIGAGPVGQTTALLLARWGIAVTILDLRPERDAIGSRAICQQRDVLDVWDCVGAGSQIASEGVTWTTSRTFCEDEELFTTVFRDNGQSCFPPFVNISQSRTEEILDQCISNTPNIEVKWNHEVTDITQGEDHVNVICKTPEGTKTFTGAYAVASPGSKGDAIRRALGVSFDGKSFDDHFLICDISTDLPGWAQERRFYFNPSWNPGRQVLIHPCPGNTFRIDWQVPSDFDLNKESDSGGLDARIRKIIGDRDYSIVWKSLYRFHSRIADQMKVGRVLLAGDAAHLYAPFGARGLNSGVLDAENAAWKLAFVINEWADEGLLESYHIERHAAAIENLEITSNTMEFLVPPDEQAYKRRCETLEKAKYDPSTRKNVDSGRLAEPFWYIDSPLTLTNPRRKFTGRPEKGDLPPICPGVLVPDCRLSVSPMPGITRLRQLLRIGVTIILGKDINENHLKKLTDTPSPISLYQISELDRCGEVSKVLGIMPDEIWVIRPDAHIAAIYNSPVPKDIVEIVLRTLHLNVPVSAE